MGVGNGLLEREPYNYCLEYIQQSLKRPAACTLEHRTPREVAGICVDVHKIQDTGYEQRGRLAGAYSRDV